LSLLAFDMVLPTSSTATTAQRWVLIGATEAGGKDREIPLVGKRIVVGRRPDRDLVILHPTVSGCHAEILRQDDLLFVRDLGSTNGTRVNEKRIDQQTPLQPGDRLCIGHVEMWVQKRGDQEGGATLMADSVESSRILGFGRLLTDPAIIPYFQPIVSIKDGNLTGYEVLARSELPGFETPGKMIATAEQMGLEHEFSEVCRMVGLEHSFRLPEKQRLYLNTHSEEIGDPDLIESLYKLRRMDPNQKITLEIHEALVTNQKMMTELRAQLNDLDIQLAYDDFGAGQTRLLDLSEVPPDTLKFDISLIKGLHDAGPKRQQMVATLVSMVLDFEITPLAEGIETREDLEICRDIGFELAQGFFIERPQPAEYFARLTGEIAGETMIARGR
jgi:EAL domain-containing protein (putative c-di-GMP-specific phosphodiesterase class I)